MKFLKNAGFHLFVIIICYTFFAMLVRGIGPAILRCNPVFVVAAIYAVERCVTSNFLAKAKCAFFKVLKWAIAPKSFDSSKCNPLDAAYSVSAAAVTTPPVTSVQTGSTRKVSLVEEIQSEMFAEQSVIDALCGEEV